MDTLEFLDRKTLTLIESAIRKSFKTSIEYKVFLHSKMVASLGPRGGRRWSCASCKKLIDENNIKVDHIEPVVPVHKNRVSMNLRELYERTYCSVDNLQIMCAACHNIKSAGEAKQRASFRTKKKSPSKRKSKSI